VAAEANHCKSKSLRKQLDALFARLQDEMESYDDGQWQEPATVPKPTVRKQRASLSVIKGAKGP
jgi:hypothetical protein